MGTFTWPIRITGMDGARSVEVEAMVDTGALYTILPTRTLRGLGVEPTDSRAFLIAGGSRVSLDIGEARVTIDGKSVATIVAFGLDSAPPVLGAYTLEGFGLAVDPASRRLIPAVQVML